MRTIAICVFVIAISTFTTAVENVYGWSKVTPVAEETWHVAYEWTSRLVSGKARAGNDGSAEGVGAVESKSQTN